MTLHTDFDDDYPEGIEAWNPSPGPMTGEKVFIVLALLLLGAAIFYAAYPYLYEAAVVLVLFGSSL